MWLHPERFCALNSSSLSFTEGADRDGVSDLPDEERRADPFLQPFSSSGSTRCGASKGGLQREVQMEGKTGGVEERVLWLGLGSDNLSVLDAMRTVCVLQLSTKV